jgi:hypothetical protein
VYVAGAKVRQHMNHRRQGALHIAAILEERRPQGLAIASTAFDGETRSELSDMGTLLPGADLRTGLQPRPVTTLNRPNAIDLGGLYPLTEFDVRLAENGGDEGQSSNPSGELSPTSTSPRNAWKISAGSAVEQPGTAGSVGLPAARPPPCRSCDARDEDRNGELASRATSVRRSGSATS